MRKISLFLILIMIFSAGFIFAQDPEDPKKDPKKKISLDQIKKAYAYVEEELLVTETDLYCSYFITPKKIPEDLLIIGAEDMDTHKIDYTDGDRMFINKGASVGIKEGDHFLVLTKGVKVTISSPGANWASITYRNHWPKSTVFMKTGLW